MKKDLHQLLYIMIGTLKILLLQIVFATVIFANDLSAQVKSVRDVFIEMDIHDYSLIECLNAIEEVTDFSFSYDKQLIKRNQIKINYVSDNQSVESLLLYMSEKFNLKFKQINKVINVLENSEQVKAVEVKKIEQTSISGRVTDENGEGLPGASILEKGTTNGSISDIDGNYTLNVPEDATLTISFVGYKPLEIPVNGRSYIEVSLSTDVSSLDEIVVVGYGTQKKISLTGSVSTVDTEVLGLNPVSNVSQSLQGNVSGLTVTTANTPGEDAKVRIRGLGTINNNDPLWVIDGVPRFGGINQINPSEIKSVTVLKDASAVAIYGARGANGVILVETIKGKESQAPEITFDTRFGTLKNFKEYEMLDVEEFGEMLWLQYSNSGIAASHPIYGNGAQPTIPNFIFPAGAEDVDLSLYDQYSFPITASNPEGTDWYDEIFNRGMLQNYSLTITGGSKNTTYSFSGSFLEEEGLTIKTGYERYTLRSNIATKLNKWFEIGENIGLIHTKDWGFQESGGQGGPFGQLLEVSPIMPVYDVMGNWAPLSRLTGLRTQSNPLARLERRKDNIDEDFIFLGNVYTKINFLKNLSFKSLLGFDWKNNHFKNPLEENPESFVARAYPELEEGYGQSRQWNWYNTLNYNLSINDNHNIGLLAGTEAISSFSQNIQASRGGFFLTTEDYWFLDAGETNIQNSGSASDWSIFSLFGKINYDFKSKYLLDVTLRRDGSSRFGTNNRYAFFPAFSVGWVVSQEGFLSSHPNGWLNFMKLRLSWGQSGNNNIGNYNGYTTFTQDNRLSYYPITGSNNALVTGYESGAYGNPNAKWETTTTANIGIDATIVNQLDLAIDVWERKTTDMLYRLSIPFVYGQATAPFVNVGEMNNRGIDVQLTYFNTDKNRDLNYKVNLVVSHYKNEIVKLSDDNESEAIIGSQIRAQTYTRAELGTSFPQFFGYQVDGIFQTQEEADNHPEAFGGGYNMPGRFIFRDVNGDGMIDDDDRTYIGNPHPDLTAGLSGNVQYKDFDLAVSFYASLGNDILNLNRRSLDFNLLARNRGKRRLYESWGSPYLSDNADATMPIAEVFDETSQQPSSYYIEDGSFLRLQSIQLGYNVSNRLLDKVPIIKQLRAYGMVNNVFTITKYSGLDPQLQTNDDDFGVDLGVWPAPRRFTLGINIKF